MGPARDRAVPGAVVPGVGAGPEMTVRGGRVVTTMDPARGARAAMTTDHAGRAATMTVREGSMTIVRGGRVVTTIVREGSMTTDR